MLIQIQDVDVASRNFSSGLKNNVKWFLQLPVDRCTTVYEYTVQKKKVFSLKIHFRRIQETLLHRLKAFSFSAGLFL